jgi:acetoacetate decarboxylase
MTKYGGKQINTGIPKVAKNPFEWQNGRFLWVSVKVKPEMAQKQLPPGAVLADDTAHLFCSYYPTATLLGEIAAFDKSLSNDNFPYHELGIRLQAKLPDGTYHHVTYILVDDDVPLLTGRDMLGTPKKMMSKIVFPDDAENLEDGAKVNMYIERRGAVVLNFTGVIGGNRTESVPGMTDGIKDVSVFANGVPFYFNESAPDAAPQYVKWFGSHDVHENRVVNDADITFGSSIFEPLDSWLVSGPPLAAGFFRMDYGKANDLKSRPVIGSMPPGDAAIEYWHNIYQSHYGGGPATGTSSATTLVI